MRTPGQRGTFGNWLNRERTARYKTQADALAAMERLAGLHIAPSEYAQWESGSRVPREDNPKVGRLYDFFGSRPEEPAPEPPALDASEIVVALREQNEWMRRYIEGMELRITALETMVMRLTRSGLSPAELDAETAAEQDYWAARADVTSTLRRSSRPADTGR